MASASYTVKEYDDTTDIVYTLVGNTNVGAAYRDSSRSLALPRSLDISFQIGAPGAKGNDHVKTVVKDSRLNSTTGEVSTAQVSIDVSLPRDSDVWSDTDSKDLFASVLQHLFTDARIDSLIEGLVP